MSQFLNSFLLRPDEGLEYALKRRAKNGLPDISVSASLGNFLKLMALAIGENSRVLKVVVLGGCVLPLASDIPRYSSIRISQRLPEDGVPITLEISEVNAKVARENHLASAGICNARVIVGDAKETPASLPTENPFDLIFVDADKESYPNYFLEAKRLAGKHGTIVVAGENFARARRINRRFEYPTDSTVEAVRTLFGMLKEYKEVEATTIAIANVKGYDGFLYTVKL
ncbi:O-methyltransferase [Pisolithus croceorrhizus]